MSRSLVKLLCDDSPGRVAFVLWKDEFNYITIEWGLF